MPHCRWRLVVVYASIDERKWVQQLGVLMERIACYPKPCLLIGGFNDLLLESEKEGGNGQTVTSMQFFHTFVAHTRLLDLGFEGYPYTWRNICKEGFIQERIDCALATNEWVQCY